MPPAYDITAWSIYVRDGGKKGLVRPFWLLRSQTSLILCTRARENGLAAKACCERLPGHATPLWLEKKVHRRPPTTIAESRFHGGKA